MSIALTEDEWVFLRRIPETDLVDAAADLSMLTPEALDARALLEDMLPLMVARLRDEGLPFSKYDREDLEALSATDRASIAKLQGLKPDASVNAIVRAGQKVYKTYLKTRPSNPVALLLPTLLPVIARIAQ
ncbi:MAG: hypothetical protein ACJAZO_004051 [Myxococcota bacterium]|jgi:hypothetical protein